MSFHTLGLREELIRAVLDMGFQAPMPIQEKVIPVLLDREVDFIGIAETGTGKTGAFGLPLIQRIDPDRLRTQGIVICPTRELCLQIAGDLKRYARHLKSIRIAAVYGGASISSQIHRLKGGVHIIVATPGRLLDLMNRKKADLSGIGFAVLDEADEMLSMGFQEDIERILNGMPRQRQVWMFSATMPVAVSAIARKYMTDPVEITLGPRNRGPKNIAHSCYLINEKFRYQSLKRIIDNTPEIFGLVFCRTRKETQKVADALVQDGCPAEAIHGDLSQERRDTVMQKFRSRSIRILVATDLAARGLDVADITHVIHYNLPDEMDSYTHRSGRTARAGKAGASVALINSRERSRIRALERNCGIRFEFAKIPDGREIWEKRLALFVEKIVQSDVQHESIEGCLPAVYEAFVDFDKEELIKRFVSAEFNRYAGPQRHTGEIDEPIGPELPKSLKPDKRRSRLKMKNPQLFSIDIGRLNNITEGAIVRLICEKSGIRSNMIGGIDMSREFSFFEVDDRAAGIVYSSFDNAKIDGKMVRIRRVGKKGAGRKAGGNGFRSFDAVPAGDPGDSTRTRPIHGHTGDRSVLRFQRPQDRYRGSKKALRGR